jgi:hypothetical protein
MNFELPMSLIVSTSSQLVALGLLTATAGTSSGSLLVKFHFFN